MFYELCCLFVEKVVTAVRSQKLSEMTSMTPEVTGENKYATEVTCENIHYYVCRQQFLRHFYGYTLFY